jgi:phenylpropionate dioxygenase-like ring-hydroxylating dioxygenase large terminal subunit
MGERFESTSLVYTISQDDESMNDARDDVLVWNDWYPIAALEQLGSGPPFRTRLLGHALEIASTREVHSPTHPEQIHVATRYGVLWACLGTPIRGIVDFPICDQPERLVMTGGAIGVAVSGLRVIENFLDLGHLSFVHAGYLGEEPFTEIPSYQVARRDDGILVTGCRVYQPQPSPIPTPGSDVEYVYEVRRPYCAALYKTNLMRPGHQDFTAMLVQPVDEEHCIAHSLLAHLREEIGAADIRASMQLIFSQDKPILENQLPKRLPLDPRAEVFVRCDLASAAFRRWLKQSGVRYGTVPSPEVRS